MPEPVLRLQGVQHTFHRGTNSELRALDGVDLEVESGSFVVVLGTNGSGKSTLLNAIAGTIAVDAGSIQLGGREVTHWFEHRRARLIGRVFQDPFSGTAPELTVAENLALAAQRGRQGGLGWALSRERRRTIEKEVAWLEMGLEERLDTPLALLSGGQRQALTLIMATLVRPLLLLLDEHTNALDPRAAEKVVRATQTVIAREGLTAVMVTHSLHEAVRVGNRVLIMHRGRVVHDLSGAQKRRLQVEDLLARFDQLRWADLLDESTAEMLERAYV